MGQSQSSASRSADSTHHPKGDSASRGANLTTAVEPASSSPRNNRRHTISRKFRLKGSRGRQNAGVQRPLHVMMEQQREAESTLAILKHDRAGRPSGPLPARTSEGDPDCLCIVAGEASPSTSAQPSPEPSKGGTKKRTSQFIARCSSAGAAVGSSPLSMPSDVDIMPRVRDVPASTPAFSTFCCTVPSSPIPDQLTPKSHWSESSVGIPTPQLPFQAFRDSLNLNRLSQLFPSGSSSSATPSSPRSPDMERLGDAFSSASNLGPRSEQTKRRKTGAGRPQIVIVGAQPVGTKRYSQLMAAKPALEDEHEVGERKGSLGGASITTIKPSEQRKASVVSTAGSVDVWDSDIPWPGMRQARASTPDVALSPRFSTTPAFLAQAEQLDKSLRHASDRRNAHKRRSSTLDLAGYVAASPELAFPAATASLTSLVSASPSPPLPPKPFRRLSQVRVPAGHPASHHTRFSRTSSASPTSPRSYCPPCPPKGSPPTAGLPGAACLPSPPLLPSRRQSSIGTSLARRARLDSVAETAASSSRGGDEVPVRLGPDASRRRSSVRRFTNCTSVSAVSFPLSIETEDARPLRSSDFASTATRSPICRDLPSLPTSPASGDFSGYSFGRRTTRPISCFSTGSDLPPDLVDAFPAPPVPSCPPFARPPVPAKLDLSRPARDRSSTASSPRSRPSHSSTPSTSSFASSLTSQSSKDLEPKSAGPVVSIEFGAAALSGKTYRPSSSPGSVATFDVEDIIDGLNSLHVDEKTGGSPGRRHHVLSLEQPDLHLAEQLSPTVLASTVVPRPRSPPRFHPVFSLGKPVSTSKPLPPLVSPLSHSLLDDSRFDSPRLLPPTPNAGRPATVPHNLPPSTELRRDTYPTFVPPSQRTRQPNLFDALLQEASGVESGGAMKDRRLGSKEKRGFDKADIGAWLDRATREREEHARVRPVVRV